MKYLFDGTVLHKKNYFSQHCWYGFLSGFSLRQWAAVSTAYGVSSVPSKISKNVIRYMEDSHSRSNTFWSGRMWSLIGS